ncbi:MAG TPA: DUF5985 family protein [Chthoniobacteraceae bacterium]|jgi:hypothetical protein|nr:DUF5985 family protein [Chthoniobacteraceae bacterium]
MIDFLSGAVTLAYVLAGVFFLRFWKKTHDRLFAHFAIAFWLLALNQTVEVILKAGDERVGYSYILRVAGFLIILASVIDKNSSRPEKEQR